MPPISTWAFYTRDISLIGFVISRATASELADLEQTAAARARVEPRAPGRTVIRVGQPG